VRQSRLRGDKWNERAKLGRPDFTNTEPAARIGPFPQWGSRDKIVAMDPYGHLAPWIFKDTIEKEDGAVGSMSEPPRGFVI
jgi:hypothetical protein